MLEKSYGTEILDQVLLDAKVSRISIARGQTDEMLYESTRQSLIFARYSFQRVGCSRSDYIITFTQTLNQLLHQNAGPHQTVFAIMNLSHSSIQVLSHETLRRNVGVCFCQSWT